MKHFSLVPMFVLVAFATACTIDARSEPPEGVPPPTRDAGVVPTPPVETGEFELVCTVPANAGMTTLCSNFSNVWSCATATSGRTASWRGDLDVRRLDLPACTARARGRVCGYVVNVSFDVPPFWVATRAGIVGDCHVSGPEPVELRWVENGIDGANLHLRRRR